MTVNACNVTNVLSIVATIAIATGSSGIGASGAATIYDVTHDVQAWIEGGGAVDVDANGSVYVDARDELSLIQIAGQGAGGGSAGFGLAGAIALVERTTKAFVGANAKVTALGNGSGIVDPCCGGGAERGLTVEATSKETTMVFAAAGNGGENFGGSGSATAATSTTVTEAYIGAGAQVNVDNTGASSLQDVKVRATDETFILGLAGAVGAASSVGLGLAVDVEIVDKTVRAYIGDGAQVHARDDIDVTAHRLGGRLLDRRRRRRQRLVLGLRLGQRRDADGGARRPGSAATRPSTPAAT